MHGDVLGVLGARGGAGASTLAALLAHTLARERSTMLVQVGCGAAIDGVLGTERESGLRWPDLTDARGEVDPVPLTAGLRRWRGCGLLTPDDRRPTTIPPEVERDVLTALRRGGQRVVIDLDRAAVLRGEASPALAACDRVLLLVPREVPAVIAARRLLTQLPADLDLGVATRGPAPGGLGGAEIAAALDLPWWIELTGGRSVARSVDAGVGPVPSRALARRLRRLGRELR